MKLETVRGSGGSVRGGRSTTNLKSVVKARRPERHLEDVRDKRFEGGEEEHAFSPSLNFFS